MARNPYAKLNQVIGVADALWTALKATITTYLQAHTDQEEIADDTIRALDARLANDRVWNQLKAELGL